MAKIGFWESLFYDVGYVERMAINENAASLQTVLDIGMDNHVHNAKQLRQLFNLDQAQSKELARLRTMVRILSETVIELGFDRKTLEDRMEDALDVLDSDETTAKGAYGPGGPFRGGVGGESKPAPEPMTKCVACGRDVLLRCSNIEERGTVCDRCHYSSL